MARTIVTDGRTITLIIAIHYEIMALIVSTGKLIA